MAQDPRKLRKLLEILTQFGVVKYESDELKLDLADPVGLAHKMYDPAIKVANEAFSMDNYDKEGPIISESSDSDNIITSSEKQDGYSDEEMLYWSATP
tara:strand:- start:3777 stop:4070 length:294 start_codon:yes stop_codon:yes gene_type:complete